MLCHAWIPYVPATRALAFPAIRLAHTAALRHSLLISRTRPSRLQGPSLYGREALRTRSFSSTVRRSAEEAPDMDMVFMQQQKLLKLLQEKPEVMDNIKQFVELLKQNGVDVQSGQMPSKMDMFKLLMKSDIRESAMKMAAALQEAGIDLQSKEMMQSLMTMQEQLKDK